MKRLLAALAALALTGCGSVVEPAEGRSEISAVKVVDQIVHNHYSKAWNDLHPTDQAVAPRGEYVTAEPVAGARGRRDRRAVGVKDESVGIGDGRS